MMTPVSLLRTKARRRLTPLFAVWAAAAAAVGACADKELIPTKASLSPRMALQVTVRGD